MILHCDECDRPLGDYLYGPGGIEERAIVGTYLPGQVSLPDVVCFKCIEKRPKFEVADLIDN